MKSFRSLIIAAVATAALTPTAAHAVWFSFTIKPHPYGNSHATGTSQYGAMRKQMSAAQSDLTRAYATAAKTDPLADETKTAQAALDKARTDYATALAAGRADLGKYPQIAKMRADVKRIEMEMNAVSDPTARLDKAHDLMKARNDLNGAEWEVLGVDADLAVSKAAITDAMNQLKDIQARRQSQLQQDPSVVAARQRLAAVRQQMSPARR